MIEDKRVIKNEAKQMKYKLKTFTVQIVSDSEPCLAEGKFIESAVDVVDVARAIYSTLDADREHLTVLFLNTKHKVTGFKVLHSGTINQSEFHAKEIIKAALLMSASAFVVVHNHPSGNPSPSEQDRHVTKILKTASDWLQVAFLDHVILGDKTHYSFVDQQGGLKGLSSC